MDTKTDIFNTLTDLLLCNVCATRLSGESDYSMYDKLCNYLNNDLCSESANRKLAKHNPCVACLGFFRPSICEETISKVSNFILSSNHDSDTFNISLTVPVSFVVRAYSLSSFIRKKWTEYCEKNTTAEFWPATSVKDVWKHVVASKIESRVGKKFDINSDLDVNITYVYADDEKECKFLCEMFPQVRKNNEISRTYVDKILRGTFAEWHFQKYFPSPPTLPNKFVEFHDVSMLHASLYVGGRYNKWSRNLSQTPWIIQGKRRFDTSVEELITEPVLKAYKATSTNFGSSGREDVDVRCLGRGRPFFIELVNPGITKLTQAQLDTVQKEINIHGQKLIRVQHLQVLDKDDLKLVKEGEESKKKTYCAYCVVWGPMPDLKHLSARVPFVLDQKTPLRVLHRRPLLTRKRTVYELSAVPGRSQSPEGPSFFKINITTQAGTYIKEFVHSDFGRTKPSLGSFLGDIKVSILALDVVDICLDWPSKACLKSSSD